MAMGFLSKLVGGSIGEMADGVAGAIDRFVETKEEKAAAELLMTKAQQEPDKWQAEINKIEAGHRTLFVAGARPFIMWVCGVGLACNFVLFPIISWALALKGIAIAMPVIQTGELMTLILSLLGLGSLRTYEKRTGLTK